MHSVWKMLLHVRTKPLDFVKAKFLQELTFLQEAWRQKQFPGASPGEGQQGNIGRVSQVHKPQF